MATFLYIAAGGSLGALFRYSTTKYLQAIIPSAVPLATLVVNGAGCLVMGFCFYAGEALLAKQGVRLFLLVGFTGAYTTFSAYALETVQLIKNGNIYTAVLHVVLHNVLSLLMVFIGMFFAKLIVIHGSS